MQSHAVWEHNMKSILKMVLHLGILHGNVTKRSVLPAEKGKRRTGRYFNIMKIESRLRV